MIPTQYNGIIIVKTHLKYENSKIVVGFDFEELIENCYWYTII